MRALDLEFVVADGMNEEVVRRLEEESARLGQSVGVGQIVNN